MRTKFLVLIILLLLSLQTGCMYIVRYDNAYYGKVVDEETREPIEGVVVLGMWGKYHYGPGGGWSTPYDAKETVTDKNGDFTIPGQGTLFLSNVGSMGALIYKSGYTYYETGSWDTIKEGMFSSKEVKWEGEKPIFPLRKLKDEERKNRLLPVLSVGYGEKTLLMIREIDKERVYRGLQPILEPKHINEGK